MSTEQNKPLESWEQAREDFVDAMATAYESTPRDAREATYRQWRKRFEDMAATGAFSPPPPQRKKFLGLL